MADKTKCVMKVVPLRDRERERESLMVGVRPSGRTRSGGGSVEGGGAGGHPGAELARLEAPQQLLVGATQPLLLVALLLHVHLQVGVLLRELPFLEGGVKGKSVLSKSRVPLGYLRHSCFCIEPAERSWSQVETECYRCLWGGKNH